MTLTGFPHSDTPGSQLLCNSPGRFAAYASFFGILVPRHSPCTLVSLILKINELSLYRVARCAFSKNHYAAVNEPPQSFNKMGESK